MQRNARILVIDDEIVVLALIRAHLESEGYMVETAEDGVAGLEQARRLLPDAIICDIVMPRLDGFRLLAELRKDERTATIPVALLTGLSGESGRQRAAAAGADAVLIKPLDRTELLAAARSLVTGRSIASQNPLGAPLRVAEPASAAASSPSERRHVALLLCENRTDTAVAAARSHDNSAAALDEYRAHIGNAVLQYDGRIANPGKLLLVATFESPAEMLPNYAGRAAKAAVRILDGAHDINADGIRNPSDRHSQMPALGIALHLGEVTIHESAAGRAGDHAARMTVSGDVMAVALELLQHGREMGWPIAASAALVRAAGNSINVESGVKGRFVADGR
ncbi:MAG TPA: response regulator, partial [Burkholderiales bacterium]|nr:response regulator [Burkholderiales bacterium]